MTREDIIRMAREAGLEQTYEINGAIYIKKLPDELLERFATLVAAAEREKCLQQIEIIVEAEREMCARIVENAEIVTRWHGYSEFDDGPKTLWNAAAAIRARGLK